MESWLPAQELFDRALAGKEKELGEGHPSTLDTVLAMGSMWQERGEFKDARELFERAIKGFEQVHGLDHEDTIDAVANLASVLADLEAYDEAQIKLERVIKAREEKKGGMHSETLTAVYNLGKPSSHCIPSTHPPNPSSQPSISMRPILTFQSRKFAGSERGRTASQSLFSTMLRRVFGPLRSRPSRHS